MELTPGYKQTQLGPFPSDWQELTIGDLQPFITSGSRGWARYYAARGDLFVRITNMSRSSILLDLEKPQYVRLPPSGHEGSRTQLRPGDLLVSVTADIGIISWIDDGLETSAYINQHIALIRFSPTAIHSRFGAYFLSHYPSQKRFRSITDQGAKAGINLQAVREIPLVLPPTVDEQAAIAGALSDVDRLLGALDRLIAKKRDLKQAAMQQLLTGRTRLPGFKGKWEAKALRHAGRCLRGVAYSGDVDLFVNDSALSTRLLRANNVQQAKINTNDVQFVRSSRVSPDQLLRPDDILVCMANGSKALVGKAGLFDVDDGFAYTFGAFMGCFRGDLGAADSRFVFYLFQSGQYRNYISLLLAGSSINNLRPSSIESLEFAFPDRDEQTAIAQVLSDMDAEIAALESRRDKTRLLKQGMMQELLTGRTRLADSTTAVGSR